MERHYYKVGYTSYEGCPYAILWHAIKFTEAEFETMVLDVLPTVIRQHDESRGLQTHGFQGTWEDVCQQLIERFDFHPVELAAEYVVFGWADMFDPLSWKEERSQDPRLNRLTQHLNDNGFAATHHHVQSDLKGAKIE